MRLLHVFAFFLVITLVRDNQGTSLKTQQHAENARLKRELQRVFTSQFHQFVCITDPSNPTQCVTDLD